MSYLPGTRSDDRHLSYVWQPRAILIVTDPPAPKRAGKQTLDITRQTTAKMPGVVANNPQKTIRTIFQEAQKSAATHRKLVNSLRTFQLTCLQQNNQEAFNTEFIRCLNRVLPVKKSEPTADRVVKFIGHFIQHVQDKSIPFEAWGNNSCERG